MRISEAWMSEAACASMPVSMFYPERGSRHDEPTPDEKRAKRMCARCPVREACLAYALTLESKSLVIGGERGDKAREVTIKPQAAGIWGGHTATQRTRANIRHLASCPPEKRKGPAGHGSCRPLAEQVSLLEELFVSRVHTDRILLANEEVA